MSKKQGKQTAPTIPQEAQEQAKGLVRQAFELFGNHFKKIANDLAEFNKRRQAADEEIQRGARRNSGRIV